MSNGMTIIEYYRLQEVGMVRNQKKDSNHSESEWLPYAFILKSIIGTIILASSTVQGQYEQFASKLIGHSEVISGQADFVLGEPDGNRVQFWTPSLDDYGYVIVKFDHPLVVSLGEILTIHSVARDRKLIVSFSPDMITWHDCDSSPSQDGCNPIDHDGIGSKRWEGPYVRVTNYGEHQSEDAARRFVPSIDAIESRPCLPKQMIVPSEPVCPGEIIKIEQMFCSWDLNGYYQYGVPVKWKIIEGADLLDLSYVSEQDARYGIFGDPQTSGDIATITLKAKDGDEIPRAGTVKIKVTAPTRPWKSFIGSFEVGGCDSNCGSSNCDAAGSGNVGMGSVDVSISLGKRENGKRGGRLRLRSQPREPFGPELALRNKLYTERCSSEVIRNSEGIRQIKTATGLVDLVDFPEDDPNFALPQRIDWVNGYSINIYDGECIRNQDGIYEPTTAQLTRQWLIYSTAVDAQLIVEKIVYEAGIAGSKDLFEYSELISHEDGGEWMLSQYRWDGSAYTPVRSEKVAWLRHAVGADYEDWVKTHTIYEDYVNVSSIVNEHWREAAWNTFSDQLLRRSVSTGSGSDLVTRTHFYPKGHPDAGKPKVRIEADGSWTAYRYDYPLGGSTAFRPYLDGPASDPNTIDPSTWTELTQGVRTKITEYTSTVHNGATRVAWVEEWADGKQIGRTRYSYVESYDSARGINYFDTIRRVATSLNPLRELVSRTRVDKDTGNTVFAHQPDDRFVEYLPDESGSLVFTGNPVAPSDVSFDDQGTGYTRSMTQNGYAAGSGSIGLLENVSTRSATIFNTKGQVVLNEQYVYTSNGWLRTDWIYSKYDDLGRVTDTYTSQGTRRNTVYDSVACCGGSSRTTTDGNGSKTEYLYNSQGQLIKTTKLGVAETGVPGLDADVVTTMTETFSGGLQIIDQILDPQGESITTTQKFDQSGRLVESIERGLNTSYIYETTPDGRRKDTVISPDGSTQVTEYYREGRPKSVYGTGVVAQAFEYGVDADGKQWTTTYTGTSDPTLNNERWNKTVLDLAGRVVRQENPGYGGTVLASETFYDSDGRITYQTSPSQPNTYYGYDAMSTRIWTGLDVDNNGSVDPATPGDDRITGRTTSYDLRVGDGLWRVTESWVNETTSVEGKQEQRLTGFAPGVISESKSIDIYGNESTSTTTILDLTKAQIENRTTFADASNDAVNVQYNGYTAFSKSRSGVEMKYEYDNLGRQITIYDSRPGQKKQFTEYGLLGVQATFTTADNTLAGQRITETYSGYDPTTGRLEYSRRLDADDQSNPYKYTRYAYTDRGEVWRVWGDVPQPIEYSYNRFGERETLTTYREAADWAGTTWPVGVSGDTSSWTFDPATGLLNRKQYADSNGTDYTYYPDGKLKTRTWARGLVTAYAYASTGELDGIDYASVDPDNPVFDIDFGYDNRGRMVSVVDTMGGTNHTVDYSQWPLNITETVSGGPYGRPFVITRATPASNVGKLANLSIGTAVDPHADYVAAYGYEPATGRLASVQGPGLPSVDPGDGMHYSYLANTDLIHRRDLRDASVSPDPNLAITRSTYEPNRSLLSTIESFWGKPSSGTLISSHAYTSDNVGRRTQHARAGLTYAYASNSFYEDYIYNDRNELIAADYWAGSPGSGTLLPFHSIDYAYDPIGNRTLSMFYGDVTYNVNSLNQYEGVRLLASNGIPRLGLSYRHDKDGNRTEVSLVGDTNCDGQVDAADVDAFNLALNDPAAYATTYPDCDWMSADLNGDGVVDALDTDALSWFIHAGNSGPVYIYTYDGENRLKTVRPTYGSLDHDMVMFDYDYRGRRIAKKVYGWDPTAFAYIHPKSHTKFVYDGWRVVLELDGMNGDAVERKFTWGPDLSGSLEGASGIGGLLAIEDLDDPADANDPHGHFLVCYDGNGNVTQLVDWAAAQTAGSINASHVVAHYEYDPYGRVLRTKGSYAAANPVRFSTKWFDDETGFGYWGYRYYDPGQGRWINRDPIGENGGLNVYAMLYNSPIDLHDSLGNEPKNRNGEDVGDEDGKNNNTQVDNFDKEKYLGNILSKLKSKTTCGIFVVRETNEKGVGHTGLVWEYDSIGYTGRSAGSEQKWIDDLNKSKKSVVIYGVLFSGKSAGYSTHESDGGSGMIPVRKGNAVFRFGSGTKSGKCCELDCEAIISCVASLSGDPFGWKNEKGGLDEAPNCNSFANSALGNCCLHRGPRLYGGFTWTLHNNSYANLAGWDHPLNPPRPTCP